MTESSPINERQADTDSSLPHRAEKKKRRTRLKVAVAVLIAAVLLALTALWLATRAYAISSHLQAAADLAPALKDNVARRDAKAAAQAAGNLAHETSQARQAASDPLWTLASGLPWIGHNFQAVSTIATAADDVAKQGVYPVISALESVDWKRLTPNDKGIDLAPLKAAGPELSAAAYVVTQSSERLASLNAAELAPQIASPLSTARTQLSELQESLVAASDVAKVAPDMLGASGKRQYLLLIQNNAESRATGGIPGALAVMEVDHGRVSLGHQTSATDLGNMSPTIAIEPEQKLIYSARLGKFMQDVNLTPDFPTTGETALAMWEQKTGDRLDGALSVDPIALSYLLNATGPIQVESELQQAIGAGLPAELSSSNVVKTLLSDVYSKIADPKLQDVYFASVAKELFGSLSNGKGDATKLLAAVTRGAEEGRIMVWSADPDEQSVISKYPVGRAITGPSTSPAQFGLYFNDGTGAKMDYYVKRTVQLVEQCPVNGYSEVKVRVTSTNTAPEDAAASLPEYVTGGGIYGVPAGSVQTNVTAYGPVQSNIESALMGGKKTGFAAYSHSGRPVGALTVRLAPGQSSTVEFTFGKIVQHTVPQLSVTPTIQDQKEVVLATRAAECLPPA